MKNPFLTFLVAAGHTACSITLVGCVLVALFSIITGYVFGVSWTSIIIWLALTSVSFAYVSTYDFYAKKDGEKSDEKGDNSTEG